MCIFKKGLETMIFYFNMLIFLPIVFMSLYGRRVDV